MQNFNHTGRLRFAQADGGAEDIQTNNSGVFDPGGSGKMTKARIRHHVLRRRIVCTSADGADGMRCSVRV